MFTGIIESVGTVTDKAFLASGLRICIDTGLATELRDGESIDAGVNQIILPGDQIHIPANMKYRFLGNISILQTTTAIMSLYLVFIAAKN